MLQAHSYNYWAFAAGEASAWSGLTTVAVVHPISANIHITRALQGALLQAMRGVKMKVVRQFCT
jgi:hypothetical protein